MNPIMLLTRKDNIAYIFEDNTLRQGLEKMRSHGYTAIPVLTREGHYVGCVSEGDFLWHIIDNGKGGMKEQEDFRVKDIIRKSFNPAVSIDVKMEELLERTMNQNFVPVIDDRGAFIGIITRKDVIGFFIDRIR